MSDVEKNIGTHKPEFNGEWVRLGDCFPYIKNGYSVKQDKAMGGLPITRIETLSGNRFNRDRVGYANIFTTDGIEDRVLKDGDILMSHINSIQYLGRSVMYQAKPNDCFIHGMNLLCLRADRETIDPAYATFYFQSQMFKRQIDKIAKKSVNQASFSTTSLKNIKIPAVSLARQREIAARLSAVSALVDACNNLLSALDDLVKSRFVEMFGGLEPQVPLASVCELFTDGDWIESKDQSAEGIRLLQTGNIGNGFFRDKGDKARYVSDGTFGRLQCKEVYSGDILISRLPDPVGRACVVPSGLGRCITAVDCSIVRLRPEWSAPFVVWFTRTEAYETQIAAHLTGTTRKRISRSNLGKIKLPKADQRKQQQFADFVARVDKLGFDSCGDAFSACRLLLVKGLAGGVQDGEGPSRRGSVHKDEGANNNWANVARNATKPSKCSLRGCGCGGREVRGHCGSASPATSLASLASRIVKSST